MWIQLAILAAVTVIACGVMAFGFVKVPALLGVGRYQVTLELPASGGLYPTSVVTYRGDEIGRVSSIDVTRDGVRAVLTLNSGTQIPADVSAAVHSRSAVGEQFVELTPNAGTSAAPLRDGDVIPAGKVQVPPDIGSLLDATNKALQAIPQDNLRTVVDEADKAVGGLGPELSRIVDGSTSLAIEAGKTVDPLDAADRPVPAGAQLPSADGRFDRDLGAAHGLDHRAAQGAGRGLRGSAQPGRTGADEGQALFDRVAPALPVLLANLVSLGDIAVTYRADLEQLLVLYPQGTAVMSAIALANSGTKQPYRGIYLDFNLNLNLPPPCNTGFLPVRQQRSPSDVDAPERPAGELYCRVPQDSALNVRGVRNIPCETNPGEAGPDSGDVRKRRAVRPAERRLQLEGRPQRHPVGSGHPAVSAGRGAAPPPPPSAVPYDPATGGYSARDGRSHTQGDLAQPGHRPGPGSRCWCPAADPRGAENHFLSTKPQDSAGRKWFSAKLRCTSRDRCTRSDRRRVPAASRSANHHRGDTGRDRVRWNIMGDNGIGADGAVVADAQWPQHLCARTDGDTVADGGVALALVEGAPTECHPVVDHHVVADLGGLPDDHAHAVVDEEPAAEGRARMDLDPGEESGELRQNARRPHAKHGFAHIRWASR